MARSPHDDNRSPSPTKGGLRLVRGEEKPAPSVEVSSECDASQRPRSRIAHFMTAWADAIDRDVAVILDV